MAESRRKNEDSCDFPFFALAALTMLRSPPEIGALPALGFEAMPALGFRAMPAPWFQGIAGSWIGALPALGSGHSS